MCSLYRKMDKARKPAVEACICHQQIPLSDWRVPTAAVEVRQVLVQALQQILRRDEAMRNLHALTTTTVKPVFFACPLFREFREPDKFAKITGTRKFGNDY